MSAGRWTARPLGDLIEIVGPQGEVLAAFDNEADAKLAAEAPALADALEKAADTLLDAAATFNLFGKPVAGTAMAMAEAFCRDALRAAGRLP